MSVSVLIALALALPAADAFFFSQPAPTKLELKHSLKELQLANKLFLTQQPPSECPTATIGGLSGDSWKEMGIVRNLCVQSKAARQAELVGVAWQEMGLVQEVRLRSQPIRRGTVLDLPYFSRTKQRPADVVQFDDSLPSLAPEVDRLLATPRKATTKSPSESIMSAKRG